MTAHISLIETDAFPFEFLSKISERESWRKEVHRPIYHIHKWWAKRLGSVFRGILLGCRLERNADLPVEFYRSHSFAGVSVLDPFMGSGTTIGEAHKLGFTVLGRDINPVAVNAVRVALGPLDRKKIVQAFGVLSESVGKMIRALYRSTDSCGRPCDVLYNFWVMQADCPACQKAVDLFSSYVIAKNAYPRKKPETQVLCPSCGVTFRGRYGRTEETCPSCALTFEPSNGAANGQKATCLHCRHVFNIAATLSGRHGRPAFRPYAKLVLREDGEKEYLQTTQEDRLMAESASRILAEELRHETFRVPDLELADGYNTRQAMGYNFRHWRDFFNDRQLLALGWLYSGIATIEDTTTRDALLTLFSGVLEFNNLFASYKGEGTGAVRHMFSHHILKPERTPIEANVWGTPKSSGSFSGLFRSRLLRAIDYRFAPTEVNGNGAEKGIVCSPPFAGELDPWPKRGSFAPRGLHLSCGDSSKLDLPDGCIDLVVTDPPFFDNVHYSELADFFYAWQQLAEPGTAVSTRHEAEVQDTSARNFARKLQSVLRECHRVLKEDGLLAFTYHHSRDAGWSAVAEAVLGAGFIVLNSQPVKSEMSVATPKSAAKEPIQLDIVLVCRKANKMDKRPSAADAMESARAKIRRLENAGLTLSRNDRKIVIYGQMLATLGPKNLSADFVHEVEKEVASIEMEDLPLFRLKRTEASLH